MQCFQLIEFWILDAPSAAPPYDTIPAKDRREQLIKMLSGPPDVELDHFDILFNDTPMPNKLDYITELLMVEEFTESLKELDMDAYKGLLDEFKKKEKVNNCIILNIF
jgi:hypothetical protein